MLVTRTVPLPVECVARGYLSGSAWKDYSATGEVCGIRLPAGLREYSNARARRLAASPQVPSNTGEEIGPPRESPYDG